MVRPAMTSAELWDRRYARCEDSYGTFPNDWLTEVAPCYLAGARRVLVLGGGEGRNALYLARRYGSEGTVVDWSRVASQRCVKAAKKMKLSVNYVVADLSGAWQVEGSYDAVVNIFCALDGPERRLLHERAIALLRIGGAFVLELFAPDHDDQEAGPPDTKRLVDVATLCSELEALGCEVLLKRQCKRLVSEGTFHSSRLQSSVTSLVAVKRQHDRSYRSTMDSLFEEYLLSSEEAAVVSAQTDAMLREAPGLVKEACRASKEAGRCRYCWVNDCCCSEEQACCSSSLVDVAVVCHPREFLRSSSTGRLASAAWGAQFVVWGGPRFLARLDALFAKRVAVLMPCSEAVELEEAAGCTLVAIDGSWPQARALLEALRSRYGAFPCVRLPEDRVRSFKSPLIDALRPGAGGGRCSTFEALNMAREIILRESNDVATLMAPLVRAAALKSRPRTEPKRRALLRREVEVWAEAMRRAAQRADLNPGLLAVRECSLCHVTLASPNRLPGHLTGRRHSLSTAEAYLATSLTNDAPSDELADSAYEKTSTRALLDQQPPEPPDVAFALLLGTSGSMGSSRQ